MHRNLGKLAPSVERVVIAAAKRFQVCRTNRPDALDREGFIEANGRLWINCRGLTLEALSRDVAK